MTAPRVRFAPSPTGYFHVGSARTALFNWLFARRDGGTFVLRIEDTDAERNREEWVDGILAALTWLGMAPDEGPYRQSARGERYQVAIEALWAGGYLYACDCTRADVDARTEGNATPGYDGRCRERGLERAGRALRFRTPPDGETVVSDLIRGQVAFPHASMEDFVVVKSSGQPLFALANVVDDRDTGITHIVRGEDLLPTAPKQVLLWNALDESADGAAGRGETTEVPPFAHLPLLLNDQGKKLSKRRDPVAVEMYRDRGYLPAAVCNYLALLGWSPRGDAEMLPLDAIVAEFRLEDVHHAPARFDVQKLTHLNGEYIRQLSVDEFVSASRPWVAPNAGEWAPPDPPPWPARRFDEATFRAMAPLVQERVATLGEVPGMVDFLFLEDPVIELAAWEKAVTRDAESPAILAAALAAFADLPWRTEALHAGTRELAESRGRKLGKVQAPIRVAVTGKTIGPPLFESLVALGREQVLRRLRSALSRAGDPGG